MNTRDLRDQLARYHPESYGWALTCCSRDPAEAEDVLQTVYLKVLEGKARYDGRAAFKTWLFSVIRNTAADARRRHVLAKLRLVAYEEGIGTAGPEDRPDESIARSHTQSMFQRALAALSARQREVLHLVFYHDLTLQEAAGVMRISLGSVRAHYDRGKKRLRQYMEGTEGCDELRSGREKHQGILPRPAAGG